MAAHTRASVGYPLVWSIPQERFRGVFYRASITNRSIPRQRILSKQGKSVPQSVSFITNVGMVAVGFPLSPGRRAESRIVSMKSMGGRG